MKLPPELMDVLRQLPEIMEGQDKADTMAHDSIAQLESLLPDRARKGEDPLEDVYKVIKQDEESIVYANAVLHTQELVDRITGAAREGRRFKFRRLHPEYRRQTIIKEEILNNVAITLVVQKIKRDIMERYEIDDRPNIKHKEESK
jgi:hypothetical protein